MLEAFDAEVVRAVFPTNIFDFSNYSRARRMPPKCMRMLFVAKVVNPSMSNKGNFLRCVISRVTDRLLEGAPTGGLEEQRLQYVHNLCDAVAHNYYHSSIREALKMFPLIDEGCYEPAEDLVSATAAVGDTAKMRDFISERSLPCTGSKSFGNASANAARIGNQEILNMVFTCDADFSEYRSVRPSLSAACGTGQRHIIEYVLALPCDDKTQEDRNKHAFEAAASSGQRDILKTLLDKIPGGAREQTMLLPLLEASANGHVQVVEFLLDSGADMNAWTYECSPLHYAFLYGHTRVARLLLDRGAKYYQSAEDDPLYCAARKGHTQIAQILLDSGFSRHINDHHPNPLYIASRNGEVAMTRFLLKNGVDIKAHGHGNFAIKEAAESGQEEVVKLLLTLDVDIDDENKSRDSPVLRAKIYNQHSMVKMLLKLEAKNVDPLKTKYVEYFRGGTLPISNKI